MKAPIGWWWPLLAILATGVAFAVGPQYTIAVPAATVAVVAAALTIVEAIARQRGLALNPPEAGAEAPSGTGIRAAFAGGKGGREDLLQTLDLLERKFGHPGLPMRSGVEVERITSRPAEEFRRYVAERLDKLEGPS